MPIYSRRQIAEHFRTLLQHHPRQHAIQMTASHFGQAAETVEEVVKNAAVAAYLHAVGQEGSDLIAVQKTADDHAMSRQALWLAVEEHYAAVEA